MHYTLMDLVADITQNGAESGADLVELTVSETADSSGKREFRFTVKDNGKGMTSEELKLAQDPFYTDGVKHPNRRVGLGLPFLIQTAEVSGGGWKIESRKEPVEYSGTEVNAWFDLNNVDTPPVGDVPGIFRTVMLFEGPGDIVIKRRRDVSPGASPPTSPAALDGQIEYEVRKTELFDALGGLEDVQSLVLMDQYLRSLEENN